MLLATPIHQAMAFAIVAHGDQKYGHEPYFRHLVWVDKVLCQHGYENDIPLRQAAYLHDVLEDTKTTADELQHAFGTEVVDLVFAVTNEPGENRKARHAATYPKIAAAGERAVTLKLADRIANVEACHAGAGKQKPNLLDMYRREHEGFVQTFGHLGPRALWTHLEHALAGAPA